MEVMRIDINQGHHCQFIRFPDGQPHARLHNVPEYSDVEVVCRIRNPEELYWLMGVSNALDILNCKKNRLNVPYLMGARYDRVMELGDSVDSVIVANMINMCSFKQVRILDPHSFESYSRITENLPIRNSLLLELYSNEFGAKPVVICPDNGAVKRTQDAATYLGSSDIVYCNKERDKDGKITLNVKNPEICKGKRCVIVDDLCDGGGTFLAIAEQIEPLHLSLIVTHGIFSKGTTILLNKFDHIFTTDSYQNQIEHPLITTMEVNL